MSMQFQVREAKRKGQWARIGLIGPPGSGKSMTALRLAAGLTRSKKIAAIDTERGSLDKYADAVEGMKFDKIDLPNFSPETYTEAIRYLESSGYDTIIVDSLSHAWQGPGGALEMVDMITRQSNSKNAYTTGWRDVTPMHNRLVDSLINNKVHMIATMRSKVEYVMEKDEHGKSSPRKVGLAPVQRQDMEFEFDLVGMLDQEHYLNVTKTRYQFLDNAFILKPGEALGKQIKEWLDGNEPETVSTEEYLKQVGGLMKRKAVTLERVLAAGFKNPRELNEEEFKSLLSYLQGA